VIQTTVANIVSPTVTAHDPDALLDEVICQTVEAAQLAALLVLEQCFQLLDTLALGIDLRLAILAGVAKFICQFAADEVGILLYQFLGVGHEFVHSQAHAHAKLGVVFEQGIRPGRSQSQGVFSPRSSRVVTTINGRTTGGISDQHAVTKQLGHKAYVRRLSAAGAGT